MKQSYIPQKKRRFIRTPKTDTIRRLASQFTTTSRPRYFTRAKIRDLINKKLDFDDADESSSHASDSETNQTDDEKHQQHHNLASRTRNSHRVGSNQSNFDSMQSLSQPEPFTSHYNLRNRQQPKRRLSHSSRDDAKVSKESQQRKQARSDRDKRYKRLNTKNEKSRPSMYSASVSVPPNGPNGSNNNFVSRNNKENADITNQMEKLSISASDGLQGASDAFGSFGTGAKTSARTGNTGLFANSSTSAKIDKKCENQKKREKRKQGQDDVRIVYSRRTFERRHGFEKLLVEPSDDGNGCYVYLSRWDNMWAVTKLLPLYEIDEFTEDESYENALRESTYHIKLFRVGCKLYGKKYCPVAEILACVEIEKDDIEADSIRFKREKMARKAQKQAQNSNNNNNNAASQQRLQNMGNRGEGNLRGRNGSGRVRQAWDEDDTSGSDSDGSSDGTDGSDASEESNGGVSKRNKFLAIVMPRYVCSLAHFVRDYGKLTVSESVLLLDYSVRFLNILHENVQMVHNDIKPDNIFVECRPEECAMMVSNQQDQLSLGVTRMSKFVFADFGCTVALNEEFPFGGLTGTLTLWDLEALGAKHGDEDGFHVENDVYGVMGCLFEGIVGRSVIDELMDRADPNWNLVGWEEFSNLVRICRKQMDMKVIRKELDFVVRNYWDVKSIRRNGSDDFEMKKQMLLRIVMELGKKRKERMTLAQIEALFDQVNY